MRSADGFLLSLRLPGYLPALLSASHLFFFQSLYHVLRYPAAIILHLRHKPAHPASICAGIHSYVNRAAILIMADAVPDQIFKRPRQKAHIACDEDRLHFSRRIEMDLIAPGKSVIIIRGNDLPHQLCGMKLLLPQRLHLILQF